MKMVYLFKVKYIGATNSRGSRLKVTDDRNVTKEMSYPYESTRADLDAIERLFSVKIKEYRSMTLPNQVNVYAIQVEN